VQGFQLSPKAVDEMMLDQLDTTDVDFDVACRWLRSNEQKWKTWLPESGKCSPQFGMYSVSCQSYLQGGLSIFDACCFEFSQTCLGSKHESDET
jgi:hypothetical protein